MSVARSPEEAFVGIDIGGTKIAIGLIDASGQILRRSAQPTGIGEEADGCLSRVATIVQGLLRVHQRIPAIGVGVCAQVDPTSGRIVDADTAIPGWQVLGLQERLTAAAQRPVFIDNDANVAALGEEWTGAARGMSDFVMLTLGSGVGGGIVANGQLVRGRFGGAAELGHLALDPQGPWCPCGNRGCLEQLISGPALAAVGAKLGFATAEELFVGAEIDGAARALVLEHGFWLAQATVLLTNIFQPEALILGGGVTNGAARWWLPLAREAIAHRTFASNRDTRVLTAVHANDAGIIGAAALARQAINMPVS